MTESSSSSTNNWLASFDPMGITGAGHTGAAAAYGAAAAGLMMDPAHFAIYQRFSQPHRPLDLLTYHAAALHQHLALAAMTGNRSLSGSMPFHVGNPGSAGIVGSSVGGITTIRKPCNSIGYSVADLLAENQSINEHNKSDRNNASSSASENSGITLSESLLNSI